MTDQEIIAAYRREHDDTLVTEAWFREAVAVKSRGMLYLLWEVYDVSLMFAGSDTIRPVRLVTFTTRGEVRRICELLGMEVKA